MKEVLLAVIGAALMFLSPRTNHAAPPASPATAPVDLKIAISVVPGQMKFDINRFTVRPGSVVQVSLKNADIMPHNWLLCRGTPGVTELEIAQQAWTLPDAPEKGYVPDSKLVLAATKMLGPQQSDAITFRAPTEKGDYPYVCTYPGHAMIMRGIMRVSEKDPVGTAPPAALEKLAYAYYESDAPWKTLPDMEKLEAKADEDLEQNVITLKPRKRNKDFGMMYDAELVIRDEGRYRFFVGGRGAWRLTIDDKPLTYLPNQSRVYQIRDGQIDLKPGVYPLRLEYFFRVGEPELALACKWEGATSTVFSLSETDISDRVGRMILKVSDEPMVVRASLSNASSRSIAVGLRDGINYCFDAQGCFVRYGWEGEFLDASPERGNGTGRGGEMVKVENTFSVGSTDAQPLRIGSALTPPRVQFLGYKRNGSQPPSFMYRLNDTTVTQTVAGTPAGRGLAFTFRLEPNPTEPVIFEMKRTGLKVATSAGEWSADVLKIPPAKSGEFTITINLDPAPHAHAAPATQPQVGLAAPVHQGPHHAH